MKKFLIVFWMWMPVASAQTMLEEAPPLFDQKDVSVQGRIRQLTVNQVFANPEKEIVVLARDGNFPDWIGRLSVWSYSKSLRRVQKTAERTLPKETILYGFIPLKDSDSYLLLVLPHKIQIGKWNGHDWDFPDSAIFAIHSFAEVPYGSLAQPFDPMVGIPSEPNWFWVPTLDGYQILAFEKDKIVAKQLIPLKPKSFSHSSHDLLPFEFQYWFQNVYWFPKVEMGALGNPAKPTFFSPWMDEISTIEYSAGKMEEKHHYFNLLTENERDDGIHYIVNRPVDLNGDGQTDFLINKFMGTGTAFRAQNYYYITGKNGEIPTVGKLVKIDKTRASGALVVDLDHDRKQDIVVVSTSFTAWAMVRALMKRQVLLEFDFYKYKSDDNPYDFDHANLHQEVLFDFSLGDMFIDGILPSLDGDFNGDGYPDVFYGRNRDSLSFFIQDPKNPDFYPTQPSGVFSYKVPRKYRIGDFNGDGKDDLVFFNTRENKNRSFTVLMNEGRLK